MLVVLNLIKKTFIIMLISFFIIELLYMMFLILIYSIPLSKNQDAIQEEITEIQGEIANSTSHIVQNKFHNTMNELLLFNQHMNIKSSLTSVSTSNANFKDIKDEIGNFPQDIIAEMLMSVKDISNREEKTKLLINNQQLNLFSTYLSNNSKPLYDENELQWMLLFLKSVLIKNFLLEGNDIAILNYIIISQNGLIQYPANAKMNSAYIRTMPFYNSQCDEQANFTHCLLSIDTLSIIGVPIENALFWCPPTAKDNSLITLFCTQFKSETFLCITYDLTKTISKLYIDSPDLLINLVSRSPNPNANKDSVAIFSSIYDIAKAYSKFDSDEYGEYKISGSNQHLSPFHSIYFNLEMNLKLSAKQKRELREEYEHNFKEINDLVYTIDETLIKTEGNKTIAFTQTFLEYGFDTKGEKNIKNSKIKKATYVYFIKRVLAPYVFFDKTNYLYVTKDSNLLLFYVLAGIRVAEPIKSNDIYVIYILKLCRYWVFFIAIILFALIIIYIAFHYIIKWLLYPIKVFNKNIKMLIDNNRLVSMQTSSVYNNMKVVNDDSNNTVNMDDQLENERYTNKEIKQIEEVVLFLKKIIYLNNKNTSLQKKTEFYQSIASEIPKDLELDLFKCQIIIATCFIKNKKYDCAKQELENLLKRIEHKQTEIHSKYEINEMKTRNISSVLGTYINQYSHSEINDYTNWTQLLFIKENCHYLLGIVNYFSFFAKKSQKSNSKDNNNINDINNNIENKKNLRKELDHYIDNAILHFRSSYKINEHLQINAIKNISILLYISKCHFHNRQSKDETNKNIKKAIVMLSKFNKYIIELCSQHNSTMKIDPRVMLIVNGSLIQFILYYIAKYAKKINKYKCTYQAIEYMLHISYYKNEMLFYKGFKTLKRVNEILQEQQNWNNLNKDTKSKISSSKNSIMSPSIDDEKNERFIYIKKNTITFLKKKLDKEKDSTEAYHNLSESLNAIQYKGKNTNKISKEEYMTIVSKYNTSMQQLINREQENEMLMNNKQKKVYHNYNKITELLKAPFAISSQEQFHARINKCYTRLSEVNSLEVPKALIIIINGSFLMKFNAVRSFAFLIINCINKFIGESDFIGYIYYANGKIQDKINLSRKRAIFNQLAEKIISLKDISHKKTIDHKENENFSLMECFDECIDMFVNTNEVKCDKYIFSFAQIRDIRYPNTNSTKFQINMINHLDISVYFFSFNTLFSNNSYIGDSNINCSHVHSVEHYRKFFRKFNEGFLIPIDNFKMIKNGFSNITYRGKQKNLFSFNLDNLNNII